MKPMFRFVVPAALATAIAFSSPVSALEKTSARLTEDFDGWRSAGTSTNCLVAYYNTCTDWIWIWGGWAPGDRIGVCFDACCGTGLGAAVDSSYVYWYTGAPSGYGYTGSIGVYAVDGSCCPTGPALASQPLLPLSGWNGAGFSPNVSVPGQFAVMFTFGPGMGTPATAVTDHPNAGPTGPPACGSCYLSTRTNHSFYWGDTTTPLCPGSPFFDDLCNAEFLWDASMHCFTSVEETSWGTIKNLYR